MALISYFENGVKQTTPTRNIEISEAISHIRSGVFDNKIETLLKLDEEKQKKYKTTLPNYSFSGTFNELKSEKLLAHSGFICLDFDKIFAYGEENYYYDTVARKEQISVLEFVYAIFISPSGTGLKVVCKIIGDHLDCFNQLSVIFKNKFSLDTDPSGKDVSRRCFTSWDEEIYVNENCTAFIPELKPAIPHKTATAPAQKNFEILKAEKIAQHLKIKQIDLTADYDTWVKIGLSIASLGESGREIFHDVSSIYPKYDRAETDKKFDHLLKSGSGNISLGTFIKFANEKLFPKKEISTAEKITPENYFNNISSPVEEKSIIGEKDVEDDCILVGNFWTYIRKVKRDRNGKVEEIDEKYNFKYVGFRKFLQESGFRQLVNELKGKANTYEYIRIHNKIVKSVSEKEIRELVKKWIQFHKLEDIEEATTRGGKKYFGDDVLSSLPAERLEFKRDTPTEFFAFFRNCSVRVTKDGVETQPYDKLDNNIWMSQVIDRDFNYVTDNEECDFSRFLYLSINGTENQADYKSTDAEPNEENLTRSRKVMSVRTGIGYCMHGYKDPTNAKSFNLFDAKITRDKTPEGRTGKSLICKAIAQIVPSVEIDATTYKDQNAKFDLSKISHDTRFIYFNDANPGFPFVTLFHMITESMTVKRLYLDPITLDFKHSPKIAVNTNYILKGEGGSYRARQFNIELSDFFTPDKTPLMYFGRRFFENDQWDDIEWNKFYSYMFDCVADFLEFGLIAFPQMNLDYRKLIADIPESFVDFFETIEKEKQIEQKTIFEAYTQFDIDFKEIKQNTFTKWLKKCAQHFGYVLNPEQQGKRNRVQGVDFIKLVKK